MVPAVVFGWKKGLKFRFHSDWHRHLLRGKNVVVGCTIVLLCVASMLTVVAKWPSRTTIQAGAGRPLFLPRQSSHVFDECFDAPVQLLRSFDTLVDTWHAYGVAQNLYETRFQEHVWHTVIGNAVFSIWCDYAQPLYSYDQMLSRDLLRLRYLAAVTAYRHICGRAACNRGLKMVPEEIELLYAHFRIDRLRGLQFALHFRTPATLHEGHRSYAFSLLVQKPFHAATCLVALSNPPLNPNVPFNSPIRLKDDRPTVYVLLPYHARPERLRLFLTTFCYLQSTVNEYRLVLIVSILRRLLNDTKDLDIAKSVVFRKRWSSCASQVHVEYNDGDRLGQFSRSVALRQAATRAPGPDNVIFQCDVDMVIRPGFFHRCVHNSIPRQQVYYPVFYSLYPYGNSRPVIMERNGFWRFSSFGMTCMRKRDFDLIDAFSDAETRFHGWGGEDIYQFETIRNASGLVAFRAVDPSLLHMWHLKRCDSRSDSYIDCMKTNFMTMGHPFQIGPVMLRSIIDVEKFFRSLQKL